MFGDFFFLYLLSFFIFQTVHVHLPTAHYCVPHGTVCHCCHICLLAHAIYSYSFSFFFSCFCCVVVAVFVLVMLQTGIDLCKWINPLNRSAGHKELFNYRTQSPGILNPRSLYPALPWSSHSVSLSLFFASSLSLLTYLNLCFITAISIFFTCLCDSGGPVIMSPVDHEPWLLSQGDVPLAKWLACMTLTQKSGIQSLPGNASLCTINFFFIFYPHISSIPLFYFYLPFPN